MNSMNVKFPLPSQGKKYGKIAQFSQLEMRHFDHLATFGTTKLPEKTRITAILEVLQDTIKVEGLSDLMDLYSIDLGALMVYIRCVERPQAREYAYVWQCFNCKTEDGVAPQYTEKIDLSKIPVNNYDGKTFRLGDYTLDFSTIRNDILISELIADDGLDGFEQMSKGSPERVVAEMKYLNRRVMLDLAGQLVLAKDLSLLERVTLLERVPLRLRPEFFRMWNLTTKEYGLQVYKEHKCERCGRVVRMGIPFRELIKFF